MDANYKYGAYREPGMEHIPLYPKGFIALRIIQLIFSVIIVGLSGYTVALAAISGNCAMMFTSLVAMIFGIYLVVARYGAPKLYNYWAVLSLDVFLVVFWLISCGLLAAQTAYLLAFGLSTYSSYYGSYVNAELTDEGYIWAACLAGAAGLAGIQFLLFVISLIMHSVMLHRHRKAGLHCKPVASARAAGAGYPKPSVASTPTQMHQQLYAAPATYQVVPPQNAAAYASFHQPQQVYAPPEQSPAQWDHPQQAPTSLSTQHTGGSFTIPPRHNGLPPMPTNAHEVPNNQVPH